MSEIRVNNIIDEAGTGAPTLPNGVTIQGNTTGTNLTLSGNLTVNGTTTTIDTAVTAVDSLAVDGNVAIGTVTAGRHLTVSGGASEGAIQITNNTSGHTAANGFELIHFTSGETQLLNRENGDMRFDTNGTEKLRITSGGFIGVNRSSPGRAIDVLYDDATAYSETAMAPGLGAIRVFNNSTTTNATAGEIVFGSGDSGTAYGTITGIRVGSQECELSFRVSDSGTLNEALRLDKSANATFSGTVSDSIGPLRRLDIVSSSVDLTLSAASHAGRLIRMTSTNRTFTIPSGSFSSGDMISIFHVGTGNMTIAQGSSVTLYNAADGATGNRTLAAKGMVTIACTDGASNEFVISGSQLS